jgi:hypothetical protein
MNLNAINYYPEMEKEVTLLEKSQVEEMSVYDTWEYAKNIANTYYYAHHEAQPNMRLEAQAYDGQRVRISGIVTTSVHADGKHRLLLMEPTIIALEKPNYLEQIAPVQISDHFWIIDGQLNHHRECTPSDDGGFNVSIGDIIEISAIINQYHGKVSNDNYQKGYKYGIHDVTVAKSGVPVIVDDHIETIPYETLDTHVLTITPQGREWLPVSQSNVAITFDAGRDLAKCFELMKQPIISGQSVDESGKLHINLREDAVLNAYMMPTVREEDVQSKLNQLRAKRAALGLLTDVETKRWQNYLSLLTNASLSEYDRKTAKKDLRTSSYRWEEKIPDKQCRQIEKMIEDSGGTMSTSVRGRAEIYLTLANEIYAHGKNIEAISEKLGINELQVSYLYQQLKDATLLSGLTELIVFNAQPKLL